MTSEKIISLIKKESGIAYAEYARNLTLSKKQSDIAYEKYLLCEKMLKEIKKNS